MASPIVIAGNPTPIEMGIRSIWRKTGGAEYERRWWGAAASVYAMLNSIKSDPNVTEVSFEQSQNSAIGMITAKYAGTGPGGGSGGIAEATETVELSFNSQTFPLHYNPTFINIPDEHLVVLDDAATARPKRTGVLTERFSDNLFPNEAEILYFWYRAKGVESYYVELPVVVWNRTVGPNYPATADLLNVGMIFDSGALAWSIGVPVYQLPTGNVGVQSKQALGDKTQFTAGWRKTGNVSAVSNGQMQITLRAEFGLWANGVYVFA